jgi:hypothetical protein
VWGRWQRPAVEDPEPVDPVSAHPGPGRLDGCPPVDHRPLFERHLADGDQRETPNSSVRAEKLLDEPVRRVSQDLGRRGVLLDDAPDVEDHHPISEFDRFVDVVGHEDDRLAKPPLKLQQFVLEPAADDGVDGAKGLVHQQHRRVGGESPRHPGPLALPARKLAGIAVAHAGLEVDQVDQFVHPLVDTGAVPAEEPGDRGDVLGESPVGEEPDLLNHVADSSP